MLQVSFDLFTDRKWNTIEVDCLSFERKGPGIDVQLLEKKFSYFEPIRNIKVFNPLQARKLEEKWLRGIEGETKPFRIYTRSTEGELARLGIDDGVIPASLPDPNLLRCSFCGDLVARVNATTGIGSLEVGREFELESRNPDTYKEVTHVGVKKVVACQKCCLEVKPLTRKVTDENGHTSIEITSHNCTTYSEG